MNRIDRVTAILIQLQSRKIVKAQAMADRFAVSLRTIYRDIRTLEEAGVPLLGEAGVGYSLADGYRLPPVQFTLEEATAFITAEKLVQKFTDGAMNEAYQNALYKVKSVLRSPEKDHLERLDEHIQVLRRYTPLHEKGMENRLPLLLKSSTDKHALRLVYTALGTNTTTQRLIEPIGIFHTGGHWHTIAFCQLRNDYRHFRLDRIVELTPTGQPFSREHPSLQVYLQTNPQPDDLQTVVFRLKTDTAQYLEEPKYAYGFVHETVTDGIVEMTFLINSLPYFARWYMGFADRAELVRPEALRTLVKKRLRQIAERIG